VEVRQLVHAVVDHGQRLQVRRERQHHRRVVPEDEAAALALAQVLVEELLLHRVVLGLAAACGQPRHEHLDAIGVLGDVEARAVRVERRLFEKEHAAITRTAAQQVLWALEYEVPAQVRETEQIVVTGRAHFLISRARAAPRRKKRGRRTALSVGNPFASDWV
jgi:hypothetical protein